MKVLYIIPIYPKASETFILRELQGLNRAGVTGSIVSFYKSRDKQIQPLTYDLNFHTHYLVRRVLLPQHVVLILKNLFRLCITHPLRFILLISWIIMTPKIITANVRSLLKIIIHYDYFNQLKPRAIISHYADLPTEVAIIISTIFNIPFGTILHTQDLFTKSNYLSQKFSKASFIIVRSKYSKKYLNQFVNNSQKVHVVRPGGIDTKTFKPVAPKSTKIIKLVSIGRLVEQKGYKYLIEACSILKSQKVNFECSIIGSGPLAQNLKRQVRQMKLDHLVKFPGLMVHNSAFIAALNSSDIYVLPSIIDRDGDRDIIANSMCEAMACGVPVITTSINATDGFIKNQVNGFIVQPNNPQQIADCIIKISKMDKTRLKVISTNARSTIIKEFDQKKETAKLISIIKKVAS